MFAALLFTALFLVLCSARDAAASPCCVSATNGGIGRLKPWEAAAASISQTASVGVGRWDANGTFGAYDDFSEHEWRTAVAGLLALHRRALVYGVVPWLLTARSAGDLSGTGTGLGDVQFGARYQWIDFGEIPGVPALAFIAGATAPTGRPADAARSTLASDTTGRGAWVPEVGLQLELSRRTWFVRLNATATLPLARTRADTGESQRFGPGVVSSVFAGRSVLRDALVLSASARVRAEARLHEAGRAVPDSHQLDTGLGLQASVVLDESWTLLLDADSGLFVDGLGTNVPGRVAGGIGIRHGFF
jgi:hypothetical protein